MISLYPSPKFKKGKQNQWDDETDMSKLEECVRSVQADGLLWGSSKLVPVGYGIKKLQIQCVVEDDKVGTDMLEEEITKFEDYGVPCGAGDQGELITRMKSLELENQNLHSVVEDLRSALCKLESRVALLEKRPATTAAPAPTAAPACAKAAPVQQPKVRAPVEEDDDDDLDLFGSDEEDDEAERVREQRLKEYAEKKAKKPALIAKSSILLDVKPWDDETDMSKLEECVRSVQADGLLWGSSKLVPVGYGIKKLQIQCVVEDDKVGTDMLEEEITKFEDYVQSVDVAAFNKI
ncbi:hypothetical protein SKAU_G00076150 [Synaphobranchus kaupii]|uniref:Elongation factor 1-delta n=1 Tax=Synaphobranchus kaupii TaxID=118154 RepID=A0A9Q1G7W8_SYNKA|nr:hypothetical protein SKAU_G00076150 [Synaphobranchus kaupii]